MSKLRWWAIYRGEEFVDWALAKSNESAIDTASRKLGFPRNELDAEEFELPKMELPLTPKLLQFDHDAMERSGLGAIPFFSQEIGPEFAEPDPVIRAVPWSQSESRVAIQRESGPTVPQKEV